MKPKNNLLKVLEKRSKGPIEIFPQTFFDHDLCADWTRELLLSQYEQESYLGEYDHFFTEMISGIKILKKSPIEYLGQRDCEKVILHSNGKLFDEISAYKKERGNKGHSEIYKERIGSLLKEHHLFLEFYEKERLPQDCPRSEFFLSLMKSYYYFNSAIMQDGDKSRKLMRIAEHYLELAFHGTEEEAYHPYFFLYKCLMQIGKNQWSHATRSLHRYIKVHPTDHFVKVLCKMYIKIGLPGVANFIARRNGCMEASPLPLLEVA